MRDVTMQYDKSTRQSIGAKSRKPLKALTNSTWNLCLYMFATTVGLMLIMLYVAVNFLLIIYESMSILTTIALDFSHHSQQLLMRKFPRTDL